MNIAKICETIKVRSDCLVEGKRLMLPYLINVIKNQHDYDTTKALLNRIYYNIRMQRIGGTDFGVTSVSVKELASIGIYIKEKKR